MSLAWLNRPSAAARNRTASGASSRSRKARAKLSIDWLEDRTLLSTSIPLNSQTWTAVGPTGVTTDAKFGKFVGVPGPTAGRIAALAGDPSNANVLYIAAAGGGVWKSVDAGTNWLPLTDSQSNLAMGSIAVAPSNPQIVYAGTGEPNSSGDSRTGSGILKTTDGGTNWSLIGAPLFNRKSVAAIVVNPTDPNTVYAAVNGQSVGGTGGGFGIFKSTDGGANWTNTTLAVAGGANNQWSDLVIDSTTPTTLYAAVGSAFGSANNSVYKTVDGGTSWAVAGNFPTGAANGRIAMSIGKSDPKVIAASVSDPATSGLKYLQLSTDAGATWSNLSSVPNYLGGQGWYDNTVAIDPADPKIIYAAGVINYGTGTNGAVISRDGGVSWSDLSSDSTGGQIHTDSHATAFDATGRLLMGSDGGIWRLDNKAAGATKWSNLNNNLQITQFTYAALDPSNADIMYGGAQDNGTSKFTDNTRWTMVQGGDGGFVAVDPSNPQTVYAEYFGISLTRSDDGGVNWVDATTGIGNDNSNFYVQFTIDPSDSSHLLLGTDRLYTTTSKGANWTALFTPGSNGWASSATINWTTIAPSDPKTVYSTTSDGKIFVSTDGGSNWVERDAPARDSFQQIVVDPTDPKHALIARNEFDRAGATGHVFETKDGGVTWVNISGNLPNVPASSIALDTRAGSAKILVGTDSGLFATTDGGTTWTRFKTGLPNAQVVSLELNTKLDILMAATHGRGVFQILSSDAISVIPTPISPAPVEGRSLGLGSPVEIARFNDSPVLLATSEYTATIDWGDGSPTDVGTIVDAGGGFYSVLSDHTYTLYGKYIVTISVDGTDGHSGIGTTTLTVADAPLTPSGLTFKPTVGQVFSGLVGTFVDANPFGDRTQFAASINWGDGKVTPGVINPVPGVTGEYTVTGTTTYTTVNLFNVRITVGSAGGSSTVITSTADVQDAAITASAKTVVGIEGTSFSATVASFTDAYAGFPISNFSVSVDWGDGTPPTTLATGATIVNRGSRYDVVAPHTYARFGSYAINVSIFSKGGSTGTTTSTGTINDAPVGAVASNFSTTEGVVYAGAVATISDSNLQGVASDYLAGTLINWGDGTAASPASGVVSLGGGKFQVQGSHTYTNYGNYFVSVQVVSAGGSKANATSTAFVNDTPLTARGVNNIVGLAGASVGGTVATFVLGYALAPIANYSATVDWGDGSTPTPGVISGSAGSYTVSGNHAYAKAQTYPVHVFIVSAGGSTDTAASTAVIGELAPVVTQSALPTILQGASFTGTIAVVSTGNPLADPKNYIASVDWGDGKSSGAALTATGSGNFNVTPTSPHYYDTPFNYVVTTTVVSLGGPRGSASGPAAVVPAPILLSPAGGVETTAGSTFSGPVATFKQFALSAVSSFKATVDWGDGHAGVGVVSQNPDGSFTVAASNTFALNGPTVVTVTVTDSYGDTASVIQTGSVVDATLIPAPSAIATVFGVPFSGTVATFTSANTFAQAGEFSALINWGNDPVSTPGVVTGGNGSFTVTGGHTFPAPSSGTPVSVVITHTGRSAGSTTATTTYARVLTPILGGLTRASDSGVSNTDGVTNVKAPVFAGRGEPGSTVQVYATPTGGAPKSVGVATTDASGNWVVTVTPLVDGSYQFSATMSDPKSGNVVQASPLAVTPANLGSSLVVASNGPTVAGVSLNPANGQLKVTYQPGPGGVNGASLLNAANYHLALPVGLGLSQFAARGISIAPGSNGQVVVTVNFGTGRALKQGGYVVSLGANGLTDLAGNVLRETNLVTFPQVSNVPNPDYVAQIDVSRNGAASAPHLYVSKAEQLAAYNYSKYSQGNKTVRVPKAAATPRGPAVRRVR